MTHDTDTALQGRNDDGVSLTDSVDDVSAYATMYVTFRGERFPVAYGHKDDGVDRPFWEPSRPDKSEYDRDDAIFGPDATDAFREAAYDYVKPEDRSAFRIPYDENDVPAVMVWSAEADEYMVVKDRDRVVVEVGDVLGGANRHEVDVVGMRASRSSPKTVRIDVEDEDGERYTVDPLRVREVVDDGPEWVRSDDGHDMTRGKA